MVNLETCGCHVSLAFDGMALHWDVMWCGVANQVRCRTFGLVPLSFK